MTNNQIIIATIFFAAIDLLIVTGVIAWTLIEMGMI